MPRVHFKALASRPGGRLEAVARRPDRAPEGYTPIILMTEWLTLNCRGDWAFRAAGRRVKLPAGAEAPYTVFVNGVEQSEDDDYRISAGEIVFRRQIVKEKVGAGRWLAMYLGLFGTYRKDETIDLQFSRDGKVELLSDLAVVPYPEAP